MQGRSLFFAIPNPGEHSHWNVVQGCAALKTISGHLAPVTQHFKPFPAPETYFYFSKKNVHCKPNFRWFWLKFTSWDTKFSENLFQRLQSQAKKSVPETILLKTWVAHTYLNFLECSPPPSPQLSLPIPGLFSYVGIQQDSQLVSCGMCPGTHHMSCPAHLLCIHTVHPIRYKPYLVDFQLSYNHRLLTKENNYRFITAYLLSGVQWGQTSKFRGSGLICCIFQVKSKCALIDLIYTQQEQELLDKVEHLENWAAYECKENPILCTLLCTNPQSLASTELFFFQIHCGQVTMTFFFFSWLALCLELPNFIWPLIGQM